MVDKYHIVLGIDCRHHAQLSKGSIMKYLFCYHYTTNTGVSGFANIVIEGLAKPFTRATVFTIGKRCQEQVKKRCPLSTIINTTIVSCIEIE